MNTFNPVIYEQCRSIWENNRCEEQLPVESLPALLPEYVELGVAKRLHQALRTFIALRKPAARASRQHASQTSAAQ